MDPTIHTTAEAAEADAMPRAHEVHSDPNQPCIETAAKSLTNGAGQTKSPAQWAYERLILYIQNFEKTLDEAHEVAMGFAGSDSGVIRIEGMGYFEPDILTFYGQDQMGMRTQLIQHVGQLSVMLRALPKQVETEEPKRIGFQLAEDLNKASNRDSLGGDSPGQMGYPTAEFGLHTARDTRDMAEHKHGEMNIDVQEKTFEGFIKWVTYVAVACIALLLFIAAVNG